MKTFKEILSEGWFSGSSVQIKKIDPSRAHLQYQLEVHKEYHLVAYIEVTSNKKYMLYPLDGSRLLGTFNSTAEVKTFIEKHAKLS